jgi:hypothetical protein
MARGWGASDGAGRSVQGQASRERSAGQRPGVRRYAASRCEGGAIGSTALTVGQRRGGDLDLRRKIRVGVTHAVSATVDESSRAQSQE